MEESSPADEKMPGERGNADNVDIASPMLSRSTGSEARPEPTPETQQMATVKTVEARAGFCEPVRLDNLVDLS